MTSNRSLIDALGGRKTGTSKAARWMAWRRTRWLHAATLQAAMAALANDGANHVVLNRV
jgi:hypothetical protein